MSDYTNIIQEINTNIPDNTDQSITALKVRTTLIDMLDAVDDNMTEAIGEISVPTYTSDLTNDSGFITATSLEPYVTKTELSNASYVTQNELNSASYVTESQLQQAGYVTQSALNSMSYATTAFVDDAIADAFEDSDFMTETDVNNLLSTASYITESEIATMGYVTSAQLSSMSYVTNQYLAETLSSATYVTESQLRQAGYVTSTDLNNYDFATETYVADYVASHSGPIDLSAYVSKDELSQAGYVTSNDLNNYDFATETYVADYVASHSGPIDLSSYVTKDELSNASYATTTQLNEAISGIAVPTKTSDLTNDSGFITASALSGLATEQYVQTAVSGLASEQYVDNAVGAITVPTKTSDLTNDSGFITSSALSGLATETFVTNAISEIDIPTNTSDLTNDSGFITASALNGLATEQYVNTAVSGLASEQYVQTAVSGLATEQYVDNAVGAITVPTKTSDLTNDSGFITASSLNGLATETYVTNAIADINMPVIDENIIPNTTNTYTLGDSSHIYKSTYTSRLYLGSNITIAPESNAQTGSDVTININGAQKFYLNSNRFAPNGETNNKAIDLGTSTRMWRDTYSYNFFENGTNISDKYATKVELPVIDESIIPNTTLTYTLGDSSHFYNSTYASELYVNGNSKVYNENGGVGVKIGNNSAFRFGASALYPVVNNSKTLGSSSNQWHYTYSTNFIENGTDIKDIYTQTEVVTQAQYDALTTEEKNSETIYVISDQQAYFDNELVTEQSLATKGFLTADNFQFDPQTGTLTLVL